MMINPNILDEGNQMEILEYADDLMDFVVRCNNCDKPLDMVKQECAVDM